MFTTVALLVLSLVCLGLVLLVLSMQKRVVELQSQLLEAYTNSSFNCLTRTGVRAAYKPYKQGLVFVDIDHMHSLNTLLGYSTVDELILRTLSAIRSTDKVNIVGQWMSGDEFIITCNAGDEVGLATRLQKVMTSITQELLMNDSVISKHQSLLVSDATYSMKTPTFAATFGCTVTDNNAAIEEQVDKASRKVQKAKTAGRRGTIN
jgi:GGDEF domain-containing protein